MLDYRKNDLLDAVYMRYLNSVELTMETEFKTGAEAERYIKSVYLKNLKADFKILDKEVIQYRKFIKKQRKHTVKLEKLGFEYLEDLSELSIFKKVVYYIKRKLFVNENKKFVKILRKYRPYLPSEWFDEEDDGATEDVENTGENGGGTVNGVVEDTEQAQVGSVLLPSEEQSSSKKDTKITEPKQMTMILEGLFGENDEEDETDE